MRKRQRKKLWKKNPISGWQWLQSIPKKELFARIDRIRKTEAFKNLMKLVTCKEPLGGVRLRFPVNIDME